VISAAAQRGIPHLRAHGSAIQLVVDGSPFLVLGGELGNSTASSTESLADVWAGLVAMGLNTVLLPVYWELLEPEEGRFDFTLVDAALAGAREHGLRLVLLWFGSWKNSMSTYVPAWVKNNRARFPYAERTDGRRVEILSALGEENVQADARAFATLMRHLAEVDGRERTVILVQVENEVGMLDEAADRGAAARRAFAESVPEVLLAGRPPGSWADVYGEGAAADEAFTAHHLARYVERVAAAGKAEYPLPMFVNAALNREGRAPGEYPSGGPLPHLFDVWRAAAPSIDFLAPDIYFPNVAHWCEAYARPENPLFIPEIANGPSVAREVFFAVGRYGAIGFSPFAVDTMPQDSAAALRASYGVLRGLSPLLLESQGRGRMEGVLVDGERPSVEIRLGDVVVTVRHDYTFEWSGPARHVEPWPKAGALLVAMGPRELFVAGDGVIATFAEAGRDGPLGLLCVEEGRFVEGRWVAGRRWNGDETHQGRHVRIPYGTFGVQRVTLYAY
jgi:beta-galactosidase GanA